MRNKSEPRTKERRLERLLRKISHQENTPELLLKLEKTVSIPNFFLSIFICSGQSIP